jgi:hypothetical protein
VQELDVARATAERLAKEAALLKADNETLSSQCTLRSQHCVLLVEDNRRLLGQVASLKQQVGSQGGAARCTAALLSVWHQLGAALVLTGPRAAWVEIGGQLPAGQTTSPHAQFLITLPLTHPPEPAPRSWLVWRLRRVHVPRRQQRLLPSQRPPSHRWWSGRALSGRTRGKLAGSQQQSAGSPAEQALAARRRPRAVHVMRGVRAPAIKLAPRSHQLRAWRLMRLRQHCARRCSCGSSGLVCEAGRSSAAGLLTCDALAALAASHIHL